MCSTGRGRSSLWPLTFGLACCAIEMIASTPRVSTSRASARRCSGPGRGRARPDDRGRHRDAEDGAGAQAHLGPDARSQVVHRHGRLLQRGRHLQTYAVLQGVDKIVPVDVYVPGCPPRPERLIYALIKLQEKIDKMTPGASGPPKCVLTKPCWKSSRNPSASARQEHLNWFNWVRHSPTPGPCSGAYQNCPAPGLSTGETWQRE